MAEVKCEDCEKNFVSEEALNAHNKSKHPDRYNAPKKSMSHKKKKSIRNWFIFIVIALAIVGGIIFMFTNIKTLPPTTMDGHIEVDPPSHISKEPMDIRVQKHMLEHADSTGPPGVIINYNCEDYDCEPDLISNLESFVEKHPDNVYVAPFEGMSAKIALTRLNKIKTLDEFDEKEIENFILY